jgi:hypothetical protein
MVQYRRCDMQVASSWSETPFNLNLLDVKLPVSATREYDLILHLGGLRSRSGLPNPSDLVALLLSSGPHDYKKFLLSPTGIEGDHFTHFAISYGLTLSGWLVWELPEGAE